MYMIRYNDCISSYCFAYMIALMRTVVNGKEEFFRTLYDLIKEHGL